VSVLGHPRLHLRSTDSTNERARALAVAGAPHGMVVTAEVQTAGRGRQGRRWLAPPDSSVLMSLLLRDPPALTPLIAAVAACDVAGERAQIKWPNDIVLPATAGVHPPLAKLAGILVEARLQERWAVVGIGMNVAVRLDDLPPKLRPRSGARGRDGDGANRPAATLGLEPSRVEPTLQRLLRALEARLAQDAATTLAAWRERDALYGREIAWGSSGSAAPVGRGRACGIDGEGRLLVELAGGAHATLGSGEVHLVDVG
jgi:BirA family transcriptional regulator, biotin operon repressor / biotin---[acetyl-CoA-carboxylase] ligase